MSSLKTKHATTPTASTEGGKRSFFDEVLDKVKYDAVTGYTIEDGEVGLGLDALQWLGYEVTKVAVTNRDYLPSYLQDAARRVRRVVLGKHEKAEATPFITSGDDTVDGLREAVVLSLLASLEANDRCHAIANAFKALDDEVERDKYSARDRKTLPKEEVLCPVDIALIRALLNGDTSYEVCLKQDERPDLVLRYEVSPALTAIFDGVKNAHPFAFKDTNGKRLLAFEYFVLNLPNDEIASRLAVSKQRASAMNREMCAWLLQEAKTLPTDVIVGTSDSRQTVETLWWIRHGFALCEDDIDNLRELRKLNIEVLREIRERENTTKRA